MFWQYNATSPQIDTVLLKEDLTLNELLDQENVIQELKSQNKKLVDFITRGDVMSRLVSLVTEEPSSELDERERYRRSNIACEVLTTDIPILNERLSETSLLTKLYAFLESEPPLNPLLASFFSRTLSMLICRKADQNWYSYQFTCLQFLDFFKSRGNSLKLLLKHLGTSAIMDLTLKLITQVEGTEMQQNILNWLENEGLVENLLALFHPSVDSDRHNNAAQLLCDTIQKLCDDISTSNNPIILNDPILDAIISPETVQKLLGYMLGEELSESSIVGGITVLLTVLKHLPWSNNCGEQYQQNMDESGSGKQTQPPLDPKIHSTIRAIIPYLPRLHDLLLNPPKRDPVKLACGTVDPPLGNTRLSIIKLFGALIAENVHEINVALDELNTIQVLLDLFFQYTWNNFLHTQVVKCLDSAIKPPTYGWSMVEAERKILLTNVFVKCRLLERILSAWEENDAEQKNGGKRRGYMGHLTEIANIVYERSVGPSTLSEFLKESVDEYTLVAWEDFVQNTLRPIHKINMKCLGGSHPADSPEDSEGVFKDIPFSEGTALQANYQEYQQKNDFKPYVFDEDLMNNAQEDVESKARKECFEQMCSSRWKKMMSPEVFPVGRNGKDDWEECGWVDLPNNSWETSDEVASNSSDEDKGAPGISEENFVDADLWSSVGVGTPVVDPGNPWMKEDEVTQQFSPDAVSNENWANFDSNFVSDNSIEQQLKTVQLSTETSQPSSESEIPVNSCATDEENCSTTQLQDIAASSNEISEKSDNNANLNSLTQEDTVPNVDELMDNFRFLSKQGMIAEPPKPQLELKEDIPPETSVSECGTIANETVEQNKEVPGDPV